MKANDSVSAVLRACMALAGESQERVAEVLGVTRPAVTARLAGRTRWTVSEVEVLADHYGIEPAAFFDMSRLGLLVNVSPSDGVRPRAARRVG